MEAWGQILKEKKIKMKNIKENQIWLKFNKNLYIFKIFNFYVIERNKFKKI